MAPRNLDESLQILSPKAAARSRFGKDFVGEAILEAMDSVVKASKPKPRTFDQARGEILALLAQQGWDVKANLKVPHATAPNGKVRLWFKTQAIYYSANGAMKDFGAAHSLGILDIRKAPAAETVADIDRMMPSLLND